MTLQPPCAMSTAFTDDGTAAVVKDVVHQLRVRARRDTRRSERTPQGVEELKIRDWYA